MHTPCWVLSVAARAFCSCALVRQGAIQLTVVHVRSNGDILVTGLFGTCADTAHSSQATVIYPDGGTTMTPAGASATLNDGSVNHDNYACMDNWHRDDPACKANLGSPCILKSDCTGNPAHLECRPPVDTGSTFTIKKVGQGSDNCDPLCNGVASFTATVDFSVTTDTTSTYSIQRGCYDERYAAGMRRLGSSGSGAGAQNVHLDWKTLIPNGEVVASPVVYSNGDVVVASLRGALTKLSSSGQKYWSIYVGSVIGNPALGSDGTIYFGSGDRNIWAVTSNGITRWRYTTPMPVHASPLVTDTAVFIGDRNGTFYRFYLDGSVAWKYHTNGEIWGGSALTRDGRIVFGSLDTYLYCLNSTTGALIFKATSGQEIVGTPLVQDVSIVYGTREDDSEYGQVVCLKMDGSVRWTYTVTSSIESTPAEGPNGEVFVATIDGKVFAIQADGQLLWKYNTGGTGGVCKQATYATEKLSVDTGDTDATDGSSVVLKATNAATAPRYYRSGDTASSVDGHFTGYRASFKLGTGILVEGQATGIEAITTSYVPVLSGHDTKFTDSSEQNTAVVLRFKTNDRMVPGMETTVVLPGFLNTGTDTALNVFPQAVATPAGAYLFAGVSGTLDCASACTTTSVKLATGGCGADDACVGSSLTFVSGTGQGQTATIVDYVHNTLVATITYVPVVADATTTYEISRAVVPKFSAKFTLAGSTFSLKLTIPFEDGTMDCGSGCTHTFVKLASTASGIIATGADVLNGYFIQITDGTGSGQTTFCLKYYGNANSFGCDVDTLPIIPDATSAFRIGPRVEPGEDTTIVIPSSDQLLYPSFSGEATGGSTTTVALDADSDTNDDFYNGMAVTILRATTTAVDTVAVTSLTQATVQIAAAPSAVFIAVGTHLKIGSEVMEVTAVDEGGKILTVQRGQLGSTRAVHAVADTVSIFEFRTISDYNQASQTATVATLAYAAAAGDFYRITGVGSNFEIGMPLKLTDFAISPAPYTGHVLVPSSYTATKGQVKLSDESATRSDGDYVGAILAITDGPGTGLKGEITAYTASTGIAELEWNLDFCGDPTYCSPAGQTDAGTLKSGTDMIRKASHYEIQVVGAAASYTGSTRTLGLTQLPGSGTFSVPDTVTYCDTFDDATLMRRCSNYVSVDTPVYLEWSSGAWCSAGGGTGWGATSPCVNNGLIVTTSANKFVYGIGLDGVVKFKYMTGKRIKSAPRSCFCGACHFCRSRVFVETPFSSPGYTHWR